MNAHKNTDVLIQNVSEQCIPNLVAAKTFRPRKIIWIYSPTGSYQKVLQQLKSMCDTHVQHVDWAVDVRNSEKMDQALKTYFAELKGAKNVVFHATGGTKSMSLQGLSALAQFHSKTKIPIQAVVMDPQSQYFDVVFPQAQNNAYPCTSLSLQQIVQVHGNSIRDKGRNAEDLLKVKSSLNALRVLHPMVMSALKNVNISSRNHEGWVTFQGLKTLPEVIVRALKLAEEIGAVSGVEIKGNQVWSHKKNGSDPLAYIRNIWMEDWVTMVLAGADNRWQQAFSGIKINIRTHDDSQEFDFLGARKNHLVYWSCKNTKETKPAQFFEIDALRDEVGGRDFHVAGLVHTANINDGLQAKAKRLGIHLVNILDDDAEEKLIRISCQ